MVNARQDVKPATGIGDNGRLGAAREDRVGIAVLDGAERLAHRMGRGCARGHHGRVGPFALWRIAILPDAMLGIIIAII